MHLKSTCLLVAFANLAAQVAGNSENVILAGLIREPSTISSNVLDFLVDMSCVQSVRSHIISGGGVDAFRANYESIVQTKYPDLDCAPFEILKEPHTEKVARIDRIRDLREYQKRIIRDELAGSNNLDKTVIVLADLDLGELPTPDKVMKHAMDIGAGTLAADVLCSNSVSGIGEKSDSYYDIYATILLPDTFVYPIEWREISDMWPDEDPSLILGADDEDSSFTSSDLFRWFQEHGKGEDSQMNAVPVRSCFGGLAMYRASKYIDERCSYSHGKQAISNAKYRNRDDKEVCEHVLWHNCMKSVDTDFVVAVQPDLVATYENSLVVNKIQSNEWIRSLAGNITDAPTERPTRSPTVSPSAAPTTSPTSSPSASPSATPTSVFDRYFTIETVSLDSSNRPWCLDAFEGLRVGSLVGLRPCVEKKGTQAWQLDSVQQLKLALAPQLCLSIDSNNDLYIISCPNRRRLSATGATKWAFSNGQLTAIADNGERFTSTLSPNNKYDALTVVAEGDPNAISFDQEFEALPITQSPTAAPTPDGYTQPPTTFYSQTFYIQSTFKFDDSVRSWCLQAINVRFNANLNVRPCEGRTKQKWLFDDGKLRLANKPQFCVVNVRGKILKLGFCDDRNIAKFSLDKSKGGILASKSNGKFYFGFNTVQKYESVRLYTEDSTNESTTLWTVEGIPK